MKRIHITSTEHPLFPVLWEIYESSFPLCERRAMKDQVHILSDPTYFLYAWVNEKEEVVGLIGWWVCGELRYVEHYAIAPAHRSSGYGSAFLTEWMADSEMPVLLEIEPVVDEITARRKSFYENLGFQDNRIFHVHSPYHKETGPVELWILSYPRLLWEEEYQQFGEKQRTVIMPKL